MSYIDGLATGLDTTSIIKSLMQLEARPKVLLQQRAQTTKAGLDAFASIRTRTSAVRTAADALATPTAWRTLTATSSHPDAVSVTAGSGATTGTLSFSVTQLAAAEVRTSADTFDGLDASLEGRTLTIGAGETSFTSTATDLRGLVAEINAADGLGVRASTIQVRPGEHQLVLTATQSGADNGFTVTGDANWQQPFTTVTAGRDAVLDVGGITVSRPTNTIDDLVPHTTISLRAPTTSPVTVGVDRDVDGVVKKVKALVDAVNGALNEIKQRTRFDPATNQRSSLTGDATVRTLSQNLTAALSGVVGESGSVGQFGITIGRDGAFAFNEAVFTAAFESDPEQVQALFAPNATPSAAGIAFVSAGWRTPAGTHDIQLRNVDGEWSARIGGEDAAVTVNADGSLRLAVAGTNDRMGGMTVTLDESVAAAAGPTFASVGQITYEPGVARRVSTTANRAIDAVSGSLTTAETSRKARLREFDRQIEAWETRLEKRELRLRQQYTALESLMGQLGNQATWLSGQIAGLNANMSTAR